MTSRHESGFTLKTARVPLPRPVNCANPPPVEAQVKLEGEMADHGTPEYATATGNDYTQHEDTYRAFVRLTKTVVIATAVVLVLMAYFLV